MPSWTREQRQAISARNHTILVSAAAGSGKTAVLVERIMTLLREGARLNRMLIVTFTRAAAAEMRQRLNQRLLSESRNDPDTMGQALDDLESAEISTIHAFCQKVLKNSFQAVGIDPLSRIAEEKQTDILFEEAFQQAMNELLDQPEQADFQAFASSFSQKDIRDMTGQLYKFLMSLPQPFDWLDEKIGLLSLEELAEHPWYQVLVAQGRRQLEGISVLLAAQDKLFEDANAVEALRVTWQEDGRGYQRLMALARQSPREMAEGLATFALTKAVTCRGLTDEQKQGQKQYNTLRTKIKTSIKETADSLMLDEDKVRRKWTVIQTHLQGLAVLTRRTEAYFAEAKRQRSYLDFSDLEQMALTVLSDEAYREALQGEYDHIFVDECQDVSAVQDAILQSIHGEHSCMFMVGDVKQSIYRFRKAEPRLFLHRMLTYSDEDDARERRIFLQKNFRSRTNILEGTNIVFRKLMRDTVTELNYTAAEELIPGRETENDPAIEIHLADVGDGGKAEEYAAEVQIIAQRIQALAAEGMAYRDMVILLPKVAGVGSAMAQLLQEQGIPVYFDGSENYFNLAEITAMMALLRLLDNGRQDMPLLSVLKMPPFQLGDQTLAAIRLCKTGRGVSFCDAFEACCQGEDELTARCRAVREQLAEWRFRGQVMRLTDFLWVLLRETGLYAACGALPEGELRQANLRMLCQRAAEYEANGGVTLSGFLRQMEEQRLSGDDRSAKTLGEGENLVRIMTIHKSKGLEFPVVFCARMGEKLHLNRRSGLMAHSRLGVSLPYVNRALNIRRETMAEEAFDIQRLLDEKAERARLLYVAMTRARERLMLIGCAPEEGRLTWRMPDSDYRIWAAESMMDWVMQVVADGEQQHLSTAYQQSANPWQIRLWRYEEPDAVDKKADCEPWRAWLHGVLTKPADTAPWPEETPVQAMPLKTSVSSLAKKSVLHDPLPLTDAEENEESKRQAETILLPLRLSELPARPAFMEEKQLTGADRGTMIHRLLSLVDLGTIRQASDRGMALRDEIERLIGQGCFAVEDTFVLQSQPVADFFDSALGSRLLQSPLVRREWGFNLRLPEGTLLQGVIDCAFMENDQWVLLDYKTDHIVHEEAFVARYQRQLTWYARALETITGRAVSEMWLYALEKGRAYAVRREE